MEQKGRNSGIKGHETAHIGKRFLLSASLLAVIAATGLAAAAAGTPLSSHDRTFVAEAAQAGLGEVVLGERAEEQAMSAPVRDFATRMVSDHAKADAELRAIAERSGFALPENLGSDDQKKEDRMARARGADFDATYMADQQSEHRKAVAAFEREAREGNNAALRRFAADTLPTLREHLSLAQSTENQMPAAERKSMSNVKGLEAARKGTGASRADAEKNERIPVEQTGQ